MVNIIFKKLFRGCKNGQMCRKDKIHHFRQFLGKKIEQPFFDFFICTNCMFVRPETSEVGVNINSPSKTRSCVPRSSKLLDSGNRFLETVTISWQHHVLLNNHNISVPFFVTETKLSLIIFFLCVLNNKLR